MCAELWEETSLSSLGDNYFLAKVFWSAALGVWKMLAEMLEPWYAPVLFAILEVSARPLKVWLQSRLCYLLWTPLSPEHCYRCIIHCGEEENCYLVFALSAQTEAPFYEEWWFLLVMALSSLILILLVVFALILHGQSKKYKNCSTGKTSAPCCAHTLKSCGN